MTRERGETCAVARSSLERGSACEADRAHADVRSGGGRRDRGPDNSGALSYHPPENEMTEEADIAAIAGQLAGLTHTVEEMEKRLQAVLERANSQQLRADIQQERIDLAARELAEVSDRLQAAANALRDSV